jgi:hypothetical protein
MEAKNNPSNQLDDILGRLKGVPKQPSSYQAPAQSATVPASSTLEHNFPFAVGPSAEATLVACLQQDVMKPGWETISCHSPP